MGGHFHSHHQHTPPFPGENLSRKKVDPGVHSTSVVPAQELLIILNSCAIFLPPHSNFHSIHLSVPLSSVGTARTLTSRYPSPALVAGRSLCPSPGLPPGASIMKSFLSSGVTRQLQTAGRRNFSSISNQSTITRARGAPRPQFNQALLRQQFRRSYADAAPLKPKKRFSFLRWTWRLTYLSFIAGTAYVAYGIYEMRTPPDQPEPDPSKKTLVVLGESRRI